MLLQIQGSHVKVLLHIRNGYNHLCEFMFIRDFWCYLLNNEKMSENV